MGNLSAVIGGSRGGSGTVPVGLVVGTRPEAIKLAPVIAALKVSAPLHPIVISTRQQRDLLPATLADLHITADYELAARADGESLSELVARTVAGIRRLVETVRLDVLIVQGDTSTSLGAALAAFYSRIPVVHVEAGLRSGSRVSPYPEEANRKMISVLAGLHLAPTTEARDNLLAEGIPERDVVVTGNTVVDAALAHVDVATMGADWLSRLADSGRRIVVLTMHRRESWGMPMRAVAGAVADVLARRGDTTVVVPAHPNPVVREAMRPLVDAPDAMVIEPLPYGRFLRLLSIADVVLTDSGGIQEEAPSFGVPVLVLREVTERPDGVRVGAAAVVGTDPVDVGKALWEALECPRRSTAANPYGDGRAAERCVAAIRAFLDLPAGASGASGGSTARQPLQESRGYDMLVEPDSVDTPAEGRFSSG